MVMIKAFRVKAPRRDGMALLAPPSRAGRASLCVLDFC
jgi:hypothetical protein